MNRGRQWRGANRRNDIVVYIGEFWRANGFAPTLDEIADAIGLKSKSSVGQYVAELVAEGVLAKRRPGSRGTLRVVEEHARGAG